MSKFIDVKVRERNDGEPGFMEQQEFVVTINKEQITLFNAGEDPTVTFVRLSCGATLCVVSPREKFVKLLKD
jgi:hypothetical protein